MAAILHQSKYSHADFCSKRFHITICEAKEPLNLHVMWGKNCFIFLQYKAIKKKKQAHGNKIQPYYLES